MKELISLLFQFGLPAIALSFSAYVGLFGTKATAKSQQDSTVASERIKAQTATEQRLQDLLDAQYKTFIVPMQEEQTRLADKVKELEVNLSEERNQKWEAIGYVRQLLLWINQHLSGVADPVPDAPDSIKNHVQGHTYSKETKK